MTFLVNYIKKIKHLQCRLLMNQVWYFYNSVLLLLFILVLMFSAIFRSNGAQYEKLKLIFNKIILNVELITKDDNLRISGYKLIQADYLSNTRRCGICIYYMESLAVKIFKISYLQESLLCEILMEKIKGYFCPCQQTLRSKQF